MVYLCLFPTKRVGPHYCKRHTGGIGQQLVELQQEIYRSLSCGRLTVDEPWTQLTSWPCSTISPEKNTPLPWGSTTPQPMQLTHLSNYIPRWPRVFHPPNPGPLGLSIWRVFTTTSMGGSSLDQANLEVKHLDLDLEVEPGVELWTTEGSKRGAREIGVWYLDMLQNKGCISMFEFIEQTYIKYRSY